MADKDELSFNGLETKDNMTLVDDLTLGLVDIYSQDGEVLNLDSNTPDGQLIELAAYAGTVHRELITEVYNSCDPDKCVGAVQDNRYMINYLTRKQGSFSLQNITIIANKTVELQGLDASYNEVEASAYTVSDDNGNIWYLVSSTTIFAGTTTLEFRAKEMGAVIPTIGTITTPVTIIPGIVSVINNVGPTAIGTEEESDSDFRIRRARSVAIAGKGNVDNMEGQLLALPSVVDVKIHENKSNTTDTTGTPAHTVWVIVEGGDQDAIAEVIYGNIGCAGTRGNIAVPISTTSLQQEIIRFDTENIVPLYIKFDIIASDLGEINQDGVKEYIAENLKYDIGEDAETSKVTQVCADAMMADGGNGYAVNVEVSSGGTATATTTSTSLTSVTVNSSIFQDKAGDTTAIYTFVYSSDTWTLSGNDVDLIEYGIAYTGTPDENDEIEISYTAGTWTDYLQVTSLADKFTTDYNKIYITAVV